VKEMHIIQRSAAWVTDRMDRKFGKNTQKLFMKFPILLNIRRTIIYRLNEFIGLGFTGNNTIHFLIRWAALRKLRKEVHNPEIRKKLIPNYKIGCKRILKSDNYYPVFNNSHVYLYTDGIEEITEKCIHFKDKCSIEVEIIVLATGFHVSDLNFSLKVIGLNGMDLIEELKKSGGDVYKGMTVPGFPNLSLILGPNTGLGHNSVIHMMESQMNYLSGYTKFILGREELTAIDIRKDVIERYIEDIQNRFKGTVWASGCRSWYLNETGKNNTLYPGLNDEFRRITRRFSVNEYNIL
jgi:cation diffusion facilitator CzcD-associated flavoprotein CzcO